MDNAGVLDKSMKALPASMVVALLLSASSIYLDIVPGLVSCTQTPLQDDAEPSERYQEISTFKGNILKNVLIIESSDKLSIRSVMIQTVHCVKKLRNLTGVFYFNVSTLQEFGRVFVWEKIFTNHQTEVKCIVVECDSDVLRDVSYFRRTSEVGDFVPKFDSIIELYNFFVDKILDRWLDDKYELNTRSGWMDEKLKQEMNRIHYQAGFLYLSSTYEKSTKGDDFNAAVSWQDCCELNRAGICETNVER